jgi:guanine nucleotide-binding protein G(i) subunit alpha
MSSPSPEPSSSTSTRPNPSAKPQTTETKHQPLTSPANLPQSQSTTSPLPPHHTSDEFTDDAPPSAGSGSVGPGGGQGLAAALAGDPPSGQGGGTAARSNAIDRQLEEDQRKFKKECKILLLGEWDCLCCLCLGRST